MVEFDERDPIGINLEHVRARALCESCFSDATHCSDTNAIPGGVSVYFRGTGPSRGWVRLNPAEVGSPYRGADTMNARLFEKK